MSDNSSSGSDSNAITLVLTGSEIMLHGLKLLGWSEKKLNRKSKNGSNKKSLWFANEYGASPLVVAQIWEDLQTSNLEAVRINDATLDDLTVLLQTMQFMKVYPTEGNRQNRWQECDRNLRDNGWKMLIRIQALKAKKIVWPTPEEIGDNIWIGSVDGTHMTTQEPNHPRYPTDKKAFSHKKNKAGLAYEIVLSLSESKIIWINGPFLAGTNDIQIFKSPGGLREKLQGTNLRLIADHGYRGYDDIFSRPNSKDSPEVSKFKVRARMRHEAVNSKIKTLRCTDSARFRHKGDHKDGQSKFKICFEAAVVVTQYKMEFGGEPLFDI